MATVLVTVGSTRFDALVDAALQDDFLDAVRTLGAGARLIVQHGQSAVRAPASAAPATIHGVPCTRATVRGLEVDWCAYVPDLGVLLAHADLVVTHAGTSRPSPLSAS